MKSSGKALKVKSESEVAQSCLTLHNHMDYSLPGSSAHGIFQPSILEWVAISFSRDLPNPGIEPGSPTLWADALPSKPPGKALLWTKLVEVTEFQLSYLKSYNVMLFKCCTQYASKYEKLSSGHMTRNGPFSSQLQRRTMPKNVQTIVQLHSFHMLAR